MIDEIILYVLNWKHAIDKENRMSNMNSFIKDDESVCVGVCMKV